jgi:hypothetical protein
MGIHFPTKFSIDDDFIRNPAFLVIFIRLPGLEDMGLRSESCAAQGCFRLKHLEIDGIAPKLRCQLQ